MIVAIAVVALRALACGGDDDDPNESETPVATAGEETTPANGGDNCEPGDGPPAEGVRPDLEGQITYVRLVFGCNPVMCTQPVLSRPRVVRTASDNWRRSRGAVPYRTRNSPACFVRAHTPIPDELSLPRIGPCVISAAEADHPNNSRPTRIRLCISQTIIDAASRFTNRVVRASTAWCRP